MTATELRAELAAAVMLLTRLPVGWLAGETVPAGFASVWAYPVVGAVVGAIGAAVFAAAAWLLPPAVAAVWALAAMLLATGALHEDGLADTADGFGGGATRTRKLEIMRDSRIGSFGAVALALAVASRVAALASLAQPGRAALALVVAAALGRAAMLLPLLLLQPARPDGLAAGLGPQQQARCLAGLAIAGATALLLLPQSAALLGAGSAAAAGLAVSWLARRQIGGYTGDVLGAACVAAECAALGVLSR